MILALSSRAAGLRTLAFGLAVSIPSTAAAQAPWHPADGPPNEYATLAFDAARGVTVAQESRTGLTREFDGARWRVVSAAGPVVAGVSSIAMTFDSQRRRTILFNGEDATTWSFDGTTWTQLATTGPTPRIATALVYDSGRDRVVLHGGTPDFGSYLLDTWEFDGQAWSAVSTSGPRIAQHDMAYDAQRGRTFLYGGGIGFLGTQDVRRTYSWDGQTWQLLTNVGPNRGRGVNLAYDSARNLTVLVLGPSGLFSGEVWEWDGAAWTLAFSASDVRAVSTAFDSARNVVVGTEVERTSSWDGVSWSVTGTVPPTPSLRTASAFDTARGVLVSLGGSGRTVEWDGAEWRTAAATTPPSNYGRIAIAYDPVRDRTVLFGGRDSAGQETWEWDGTTWTQVGFGGSGDPSARRDHALAFDPATSRVLLFGGVDSNFSPLGDTWTWDGGVWTQAATSGPGPRSNHALATDSVRQRVVLFGGDRTANPDETWEWDGAAWHRRATTGPRGRIAHDLVYDPLRRRTVLYGGADGSATFTGTWEWDGVSWVRTPVQGFGPRFFHQLFFDPELGRVVSFGGDDGTIGRRDLTQLSYAGFGVGCASPGATNPPRVTLTDDRPAIGGTLDVATDRQPVAATFGYVLFGGGPVASAIALDPIGLPDCSLLVPSVLAVAVVGLNGGAGALSVPIPNDPMLVGDRVVVQTVAADPGANPLGFVLSDAAVARFR